jgi:hypothetical protein
MEKESNKMTAVEWLWEQIDNAIPYQNIKTSQIFSELLEQAKEMDREQRLQDMSKMQIISDVSFDGDVTFMFNPKKYYAKTYGGKDGK